MAAAGYKQFFFALIQLTVSLQRHRFNTFRINLGHKLGCKCWRGGAAELLPNTKMQSRQTRGQERISPGFGAHLFTHECRRESIEHGSGAINSITVSVSLADISPATRRWLISCKVAKLSSTIHTVVLLSLIHI